MKKILALVLALVMTMSVAAISSSAAFSDADDVRYTDAVNTLAALGVLGGYADGSIRPQADVTRGAAAKMVAMVATGSNTTAIGYYKGTSSFSDVPATHTFADAVAFCVARGIVEGYGDGTYGVGANVKGWAVAKMVLVAMGYDAKAYGMSGTGAALNTITLASQVGLFAGMKADFVATEAASREECAQIVYNALTKEGKVANPTSSDGVVSFSDSKTCLLNNYNGIAKVTETAMDNGVTAMAAMAANIGMLTANQATGATATTIGRNSYAVETGKDLIGHVVLAVPNGAVDAYGVPCVYAVVDLSSVVEVAEAIAANDAKKADKFKAAFGTALVDSTYATFANYNQGADGSMTVADSVAAAGTYVVYNNAVASYLTSTSDLVVLDIVVDNATKGYYTVKNGSTELVKVAEAASACKNLITSDAAIDWLAKVATGASSAKAVYVGTPCGSKLAVEDVKVVEGKASLINASTQKITVNGKVYDFVTTEATAAAAMGIGVAAMTTAFADVTNTYKFYLDEAGKIFAASKVTSSSADTNTYALAYVVGTKDVVTGVDATYGTESHAYSVQYYTVDGAVNTAAYYAYNGFKIVASNPQAGEVAYGSAVVTGWKLVAKTANGVVVKDVDTASGYTVVSDASGSLTATSTKLGNYFVNKASAFVYSAANAMDAANVAATVKAGAHVATIAANTSIVVKDSANVGAKDVVAVWVGANYVGSEVAADFVYVASYEGYVGKDATGTADLHSYKVIDKNGVASTATYTVASNAASYAGKFYELSTNSASGLTSFGNEKTDVANIYASGMTSYVVDGVKYLNNGSEYVVSTALKLHDLRAAVAAGTATAVASVDDMLKIEGTYTAYALTSTDATTGVVTINTIIVK